MKKDKKENENEKKKDMNDPKNWPPGVVSNSFGAPMLDISFAMQQGEIARRKKSQEEE